MEDYVLGTDPLLARGYLVTLQQLDQLLQKPTPDYGQGVHCANS